jgi:hypothetical protein
MARRTLPEISPWKRQSLTIPPDSLRAWFGLAAWECWMGALVAAAVVGTQLIVTAPGTLVIVYDFTNATPRRRLFSRVSASPADRRAERGVEPVVRRAARGAAWLLWELWNAVAPRPITDDFLRLLDDSFGRDWRRPRTCHGRVSVGLWLHPLAPPPPSPSRWSSRARSSSVKAPTALVEALAVPALKIAITSTAATVLIPLPMAANAVCW